MLGWAIRGTSELGDALVPVAIWTPVATIVAILVYAGLTVVGGRMLSLGLREGYHPVRSRVGWQLWATERLMDAARNYLFPIYASLLTPWWLRLLGAKIGKGVWCETYWLPEADLITLGDGVSVNRGGVLSCIASPAASAGGSGNSTGAAALPGVATTAP